MVSKNAPEPMLKKEYHQIMRGGLKLYSMVDKHQVIEMQQSPCSTYLASWERVMRRLHHRWDKGWELKKEQMLVDTEM